MKKDSQRELAAGILLETCAELPAWSWSTCGRLLDGESSRPVVEQGSGNNAPTVLARRASKEKGKWHGAPACLLRLREPVRWERRSGIAKVH